MTANPPALGSQQWHDKIATPAIAGFAIVLLIAGTLLAGDKISGVEASSIQSDQAHSAQLAAEELFSTIKDAETGQRGYLLTNDGSYLVPFDAARVRLDEDFARLEATAYANPVATSRIRRIRELAKEKMDELGHTIALQQSGNHEEAQAIVRSDQGERLMDAIRTQVAALQSEEEAGLVRVRYSWTWLAAVSLVIIACGLLCWTAIKERRARAHLATMVISLTGIEAELRESELMLRQSRDRAEQAEALLRDAVESMSEGFVIYDREDRFVMCNERYRELFPERADLLVPGAFFENILLDMIARGKNAEHRGRDAAILQDRLRFHRDPIGSVERQQGDGTWILATDRRMSDGGIAGLRVNITALKLSQMALANSETRLDRAQQIAGIGSWEIEVATGRVAWSKQLYSLFGTFEGAFAPTLDNSLDLFHADDRPSVQSWINDLVAGTERSALEARGIRPDGKDRLFRLEGRAITDPDGSVRHLAGTIQDVTGLRLIERQLAQSQKMEAIGNLTGGMAHDFNNGLGVIIGNLDLLKRLVKNNANVMELCGEALDGAHRCADLIRMLLAFARQQPLKSQQFDVTETVERTIRLLSRTLGEDIALTPHLEEFLPPVVADPAGLEAALTNLANNARDAMPRGGRLDIRTKIAELGPDYAALHRDVKPGAYVLIEVSDTGTGIAPELLNRIFEPFFTTKEPGHGTGLGLSMVYGFAAQSGGHVAVYSEPGLGTTFRIYLPSSLGKAIKATNGDPLPVVGGDETVLMVEDNAALRRVAARQLRELGYQVREAEDAAVALAILTSPDRVDLLFTDVVMPGTMDGVDLADDAVRSRQGLKVLLTSGFPGLRVTHPGTTDCRFPLLTKPYSRNELAWKLREILNDRSGPITDHGESAASRDRNEPAGVPSI